MCSILLEVPPLLQYDINKSMLLGQVPLKLGVERVAAVEAIDGAIDVVFVVVGDRDPGEVLEAEDSGDVGDGVALATLAGGSSLGFIVALVDCCCSSDLILLLLLCLLLLLLTAAAAAAAAAAVVKLLE